MRSATNPSSAREVVDEHVRWAERAACALAWQDRADIGHLGRLVSERNADRRLRVGVFGQFSSGKSTLLNALLGAGLLPSSARVTTTAATRLSPAASDSLTVTLREPTQTLKFGTDVFGAWYASVTDSAEPAGIRAALQGIMRSPRATGRLHQIDVNLAGTALGPGVLVIDTPGFDAAVAGHHDVAARVAAEVDLAIVLIPAYDPGSMALARFLHEALNDLSDRCVFVLTKFRQVPREQRADLHEHIVSWLERQGFPEPTVLRADATDIAVAAREAGAGATALITATAGEIPVEAAVQETAAIARELRALATDRRQQLIEATLEVLVARLLVGVTRAADDRRVALEHLRAQLDDVPIAELSDFLGRWRDDVIVELARSLRQSVARQAAAAGPDYALERARDRAVEEVGSGTQITEIVADLVSETQHVLDDWMKRALRRAADESGEDLSKQAELLKEAFTAQYAELADLSGADPQPPHFEYATPAITVPSIDLAGAADEQFQPVAPGTSALTAAIAASLVFPMAGLAIVGALSRAKRKEQLRIYAENMHQDSIAAARNAIRAAEPDLRAVFQDAVDILIARYLRSAGPAVDQLADGHRVKIARIDADLREVLAIGSQAQRRQTALAEHGLRPYR